MSGVSSKRKDAQEEEEKLIVTTSLVGEGRRRVVAGGEMVQVEEEEEDEEGNGNDHDDDNNSINERKELIIPSSSSSPSSSSRIGPLSTNTSPLRKKSRGKSSSLSLILPVLYSRCSLFVFVSFVVGMISLIVLISLFTHSSTTTTTTSKLSSNNNNNANAMPQPPIISSFEEKSKEQIKADINMEEELGKGKDYAGDDVGDDDDAADAVVDGGGSGSGSGIENGSFEQTLNELYTKLSISKNEFHTLMKNEYGEYYYNIIFQKHNVSDTITIRDKSKERLIRRFMLSILRAQRNKHKRRKRKLENERNKMRRRVDSSIKEETLSSSLSSSSSSSSSTATTTTTTATKFTWVSAGHSASAGHGNLYSQSYTASMVRGAYDAFESLGIELIGKNYGMGGMSSGPEIALCMESIFGGSGYNHRFHHDVDIDVDVDIDIDIDNDDSNYDGVDILSWDFGMTDGRDYEKLTLWGERAFTTLPSKPILLLRAGGKDSFRFQKFIELEERGMTTALMSANVILDELKDILPDGSVDGSQDNITDALKYMVCNGGIESNVPCRTYKFNTTPCVKAKHQTSWHPGWKDHLLQGNLIANFLIETLTQSLSQLTNLYKNFKESGASINNFVTFMIHALKSQEFNDYQNFIRLPTTYKENDRNAANDNIQNLVNVTTLCRSKSICHTALLPADSRYNGFVITAAASGGGVLKSNPTTSSTSTSFINVDASQRGKGRSNDNNDSNNEGSSISYFGKQEGNVYGGYDVGIEKNQLQTPSSNNDNDNDNDNDNKFVVGTFDKPKPVPLVYDEAQRQLHCPYTLKVDFKDVFYVRQVDGWMNMVVPTNSEIEAYSGRRNEENTKRGAGGVPNEDDGDEEDNVKGLIVICLSTCDWGKCPPDYITLDQFIMEEEEEEDEEEQEEENDKKKKNDKTSPDLRRGLLEEEKEQEYHDKIQIENEYDSVNKEKGYNHEEEEEETEEDETLEQQQQQKQKQKQARQSITIEVNGEPIIGWKRISDKCAFLERKHNDLHWGGRTTDTDMNSDSGGGSSDSSTHLKYGQYELKFYIHKPGATFWISSIIVL